MAYLSKVISLNYDKSVTPSFIGKLASAAENGVTYNELLCSAGYDPELHPQVNPSNDFEKLLEDKYRHGLLDGYMMARNDVFDSMTGNENEKDICLALCSFDGDSSGLSRTEPAPVLRPGYVVRFTTGSEQYILASIVSGEIAVSISPWGELKLINIKEIVYTGHRIPEELLTEMLLDLKER